MDPRTGKIIQVPDDVANRLDIVPIPEDELARVTKMNRHDRRAWAAQQRKKAKART